LICQWLRVVTLVTGMYPKFDVFSFGMALEALLLSRDSQVVKTLRRVLDEAHIDLKVCSNAEEALTILNRHKYDTFLVDCDDVPGATAVLRQVRNGKSNKSCIAFAVVNGRTTAQQAFEMGANFALDKPLSVEKTHRSVRAAHGLMMRERRRYYRHLINVTGAIIVDATTELPVNITTISEGGVSIECSRQLDQGGAARLKILLPGSKRALDLKGEVIWASTEGRAGIRFQVLPVDAKKELEAWLEKRALSLDRGAMFINAVQS
jgi:CheY-like chemotaxis protein